MKILGEKERSGASSFLFFFFGRKERSTEGQDFIDFHFSLLGLLPRLRLVR